MGFFQTLKHLYKYIRPHRRQFILGLCALLVVDALNALPPLLLKGFIDQASEALKGDRNYAPFFWFGLLYAIIALGQGVCRYLWRMLLIRASHRAAEKLREEYFAKLQRLAPAFYDQNSIGDLMALATNDVEAVRFAMGPGLLLFADATFLFLALPPVMYWLSPKLTFLALIPMIVVPFIIRYGEKKVHDRFEQVQAQFSKLTSFAQENLNGIHIIKAFVREWTQLGRFSQLGREFVRLNLKLANAQSIFEPVFILAMSLGLTFLFIFAGKDVITGAVGLGTFIAFTRYLENLAWPTMAIGAAITHYQRGKTSLERILQILNEKELPIIASDESKASSRKMPKHHPLLEAKNLSFAYPGQAKLALKNINFRLERNTRSAIVGPVGSGKSTLIRLLCGLYDIAPGMLFWEGTDVTQIPLLTRRELFTLVPQEVFLFSESLHWNVSMGLKNGLNQDEVAKALTMAGLESELLNWGKDFSVGERGLNLSGGQRARVTLARALARQTPLLILDDALSSIDSETESKILTNLEQITYEQTTLMVTHRFASLYKFDQVLVLNSGELIQNGSPQLLSKSPGLYQRLLELQRMEDALA